MNVFQSTSPLVEVSGLFVHDVVRAIERLGSFNDLQEYKTLKDADPFQDYPSQSLLNLLKAIHDESPDAVHKIARSLLAHHIFSDDVKNFHDALNQLEHFCYGYMFPELNPNIEGRVLVGPISKGIYRVVVRTLFPCEFDTGLIMGMAERFDKKIRIDHNDFICRIAGKNDYCDYLVVVID